MNKEETDELGEALDDYLGVGKDEKKQAPVIPTLLKETMRGGGDSDDEFDFETEELLVPVKVVEEYGEAMQTDSKRQLVEFQAVDKGKNSENDETLFKSNKPKKWKDSHLVDLARGVPLVSLNEDVYKIKGQNFVCLSFIHGDQYDTLQCGNRLYRGDLIKIRGVFRIRENADRFIKEVLTKNDPNQKVVLARMFSWTMLEDEWDDDETADDVRTNTESMIRGYFENENLRVSSIQRRINMVRSKNKARAKETNQFFEKMVEDRQREKEDNEKKRQEFETTDKLDIDQVNPDEVVASKVPLPVMELKEDPSEVKIDGQSWACVSYIPPSEYKSPTFPNEDMNRPLLKIRGIFPTREKAEAHIEQKIQTVDSSIDVSLVPCFKWAGLEDDSIEDREYMGGDQGIKLKQLIGGYLANKNDRIASTPQQRVMDARAKQAELVKRGVTDPSSMPFDAGLIQSGDDNAREAGAGVAVPPPVTSGQEEQEVEVHEAYAKKPQTLETLKEDAPSEEGEDGPAAEVTIMGAKVSHTRRL